MFTVSKEDDIAHSTNRELTQYLAFLMKKIDIVDCPFKVAPYSFTIASALRTKAQVICQVTDSEVFRVSFDEIP